MQQLFADFQVSEMRFELTQPFGHYPLKVACLPIPPPGQAFQTFVGNRAKNGTRTRDPDLGKVVLYQLSYFRILSRGEPLFAMLFGRLVTETYFIVLFERKTGLEPATPTLARSCSTN